MSRLRYCVVLLSCFVLVASAFSQKSVHPLPKTVNTGDGVSISQIHSNKARLSHTTRVAVPASDVAPLRKNLGNPALLRGSLAKPFHRESVLGISASVINVPGTYPTIQSAINAAADGDTINVYPSTYNSDTANGFDPTSGGAGSNDFNIFVNKSVTIRGVDISGNPITDFDNVAAFVSPSRNLPTFGADAFFVQADNVSITGLDISGYPDVVNYNSKTVEVGGDNFTLKYCKVHGLDEAAAVYISDWHYDSGTNTSHIQSYRFDRNYLEGGGPDDNGIRIASGAGWSGSAANRIISGNTITNAHDNIAFVGPGAEPWDLYPVGAATISGNSFSNAAGRHVIAWGEYQSNLGYANLDWAGILASNTFDAGVVPWTPTNDVRTWDLPGNGFYNIRGIYTQIQKYAITYAQSGDHVQILAGTYFDTLNISVPLTLYGAGQGSTIVYPLTSNPNPCAGSSLCGGSATNLILVGADSVTIHDLTLNGDNPNLTSGIIAGGADLDARNGIIENYLLGVFNNLTVYNVTVKNIYLRGMYASTGGTFNFHDNTVQNVQADPSSIAMFNFGGSGVFANNTVSDAGDAISANWSMGTSFLNNTITNSGSGIHTDNSGGGGSVHPDTIAGNTVSNSPDGGYGIWDFVPYVAPVIRDNSVTNVYVGLGAFASVLPSGSTGTTFLRNTVDGQNKSNSTGLYVSNTEFGYGISNVSALLANNIVKNNVYGFWIESAGGDTVRLTANANAIFSNTTEMTTDSVTSYNGGNGTVGTVLGDLRGNWWGNTSEPAVGGPSASSVTFSPWFGIGTDAQPATGGFQPVTPMNWFMNTNSSVQSAVNFVAAGDTLNVLGGTYEEQVEITKTLLVKGVGIGVSIIKSPVTLTKFFTTSVSNYPVVYVHDADGVNIENLTVDGAGRGNGNYRFLGIGYHNGGGLISGCEVKDVRETPISGTQQGNGIYAYVDNATPRVLQVLNNTVYGFQKNGITLNGTNLSGTVSGNTVTGAGAVNFIAQNGVQIGFGGAATVTGNTISGFSYTPNTDQSCGVLLYLPTGPITTSNNIITESQIGVDYVNVSGTVSGNTIHATLAGVGTPGIWGIEVDPGSVIRLKVQPVDGENATAPPKFRRTLATTIVTTVQQNVLTGDGSSGTGLEMDASSGQTVNVTAAQNSITGWNTGVIFWTDGPTSTLNATVNDNDLSGSVYGASNSTSTVQDASANWWGNSSGPKIAGNPGASGDSVSANVDFTPWLNSGTDVSAGIFGFQGDYSILDVLAASPQTGSLGRIQEGVNLVTGSLVNVLAGTYEEQVELAKPVTLLGAGTSSTTIKSPVTLTKFFTTSASNYPIVYGHDADNVNVENLTVDGAGRANGNYRFIGLGYHNAGGTISGCVIKDVRETPISGTQHGIGVYAYVDNATPRVLQVANDTISGFQKNGMALSGTNLTANVSGNTVTGAGAVNFIAQNGIQISSGATGSVTGNTISGFSYTPASTVSCGALLYDPAGPIVTANNTISESQVGIYYIEVGGTISGNTVHATAAGVGVPGYWGIDVDPGAAPKLKVQPFDQAASPSKSVRSAQGLAATINTTVRNNTLTSDGTNGVGLEMDALGTDVLNVSAARNTISQWGTGVSLYRDSTATLTAIVDTNSIAGNVYGFYNPTGVLGNALYNWWGNASGPRDVKTLPNVPNYHNVAGLGDSVSSYVDYKPWFVDAGMTTTSQFTVSASAGPHGSITPSGTSNVNFGDSLVFTITPQVNYHVSDVVVDGNSVGAVTSYTLRNISGNHAIIASFTITGFTITATAGSNGSITPSGPVGVNSGTDTSFTITPATGYHLDSVIVDGAYAGHTSPYSFINITSNHTIRATFAINTFTIIATVIGANGTVSPAGTTIVTYGSNQPYTMTPATGYHVDTIFVDGVPSGNTSPYTFTGVTASHSISVKFAINNYILTVNIVGSGSVTRMPSQASYNYGTSVQLTAVPSDYTWLFTGWTGSVTSASNSILILTDSAMTLTANFVRDTSYLSSYRSFTMDSIGYDRDNTGKLGKFVQLKPVYAEFTVTLLNTIEGITGMHIEFASQIDTVHFPFQVVPASSVASTDGRYKRWDLFFNSPLHAGDSVFLHGFAPSSKGQKVTIYFWTHFNTRIGPTFQRAPIVNVEHMPMPNRINALVQTFLQGGYWKTKGLLVGYTSYDSAKVYGWYLAPNYKEVLESLRDRTGLQQGTPRNFDYFTNGRPLIRQQAHLEPSRYNNKLFGDVVVLQFNIASSALGITPHGFGELVYDDGTSNPLNGLMVRQIDSVADSMMAARTYSARFASKSYFESTYGYVNMDSTIARINYAFEGKLDTISFISSLQFKGMRQLSTVPYLKKMPSGVNVEIIVPNTGGITNLPQEYALYQNYPNPFNPTTTIRFDLPVNSVVTLKVYNLLGQEVSTLLNAQRMTEGTQAVEFNAGNLASGVYFYRIISQRADGDGVGGVAYQTVKKMLLLK